MGSGVTKEQIQAYEAWERSYKDKEGSLEKRREALENVKRLHNEKAEELHQHEAELKAEQDTLKKAELSEKTAEQKLQKDRAALEEDRKRLEEKEQKLKEQEQVDEVEEKKLGNERAAVEEERVALEEERVLLQKRETALERAQGEEKSEEEKFSSERAAWEDEKRRFEEAKRAWEEKMKKEEDKMRKGPWAERIREMTGDQKQYDEMMAIEDSITLLDTYVTKRVESDIGCELKAAEREIAVKAIRARWTESLDDIAGAEPYIALTAVESRLPFVTERVKLLSSDNAGDCDKLCDLLLQESIDETACKAVLDGESFDINRMYPYLKNTAGEESRYLDWLTPLVRIAQHFQLVWRAKLGHLSFNEKPKGVHANALKWLLTLPQFLKKCASCISPGGF